MKGLLLCVLVCGTAFAQSDAARLEESKLRDSLVKKELFLKDLNADTKIHVEWNGTEVVGNVSHIHTLAVWQPSAISIKKGSIVIKGNRYALLRTRTAAKPFTTGAVVVPVTLTIELHGEEAAILPGLKKALFYNSLSEALTSMPRKWRVYVPADDQPALPGTARAKCDCAEDGMAACDGKYSAEGAEAPIPLRKPATELWRMTGSQPYGELATDYVFEVDASGAVGDVWLTRPGGYGLEFAAIEAERRVPFKPGTCHGVPHASIIESHVSYSNKP